MTRILIKYSQSEIDFLKENYHKYSAVDLSKMMNRTPAALLTKSLRLGLGGNKEWARSNNGKNRRKFSFDYDFFEKIDTHEKAYWYGFIWADGSVNTKNYLTIGLHNKDGHHLDTFNKHINSTYKTFKSRQMIILTLKNKKTIEDLNKLNIVPNKTYKDGLPIVSDEFFFSWLLGFFDGDGCCLYRKLSFCTRPIVADWLSKKMIEYGLEYKIYKIKNKQNVNFQILKKQSVVKASELMTQNINFNLERKKPHYRVGPYDPQKRRVWYCKSRIKTQNSSSSG